MSDYPRISLVAAFSTKDDVVAEQIKHISINTSVSIRDQAKELITQALELNISLTSTILTNPNMTWLERSAAYTESWSKNLEMLEDYKKAMSILDDYDKNPFKNEDCSSDWLDWFKSNTLTCQFKVDTNISQELESGMLETLIKTNSFSFTENPECYSELSEHFNDDVLNLYEQKNPDELNEDGNISYEKLTDSLFDELLNEITDEQSISVILGIGNIYSICREIYSNEIYDYIFEKAESAFDL